MRLTLSVLGSVAIQGIRISSIITNDNQVKLARKMVAATINKESSSFIFFHGTYNFAVMD